MPEKFASAVEPSPSMPGVMRPLQAVAGGHHAADRLAQESRLLAWQPLLCHLWALLVLGGYTLHGLVFMKDWVMYLVWLVAAPGIWVLVCSSEKVHPVHKNMALAGGLWVITAVASLGWLWWQPQVGAIGLLALLASCAHVPSLYSHQQFINRWRALLLLLLIALTTCLAHSGPMLYLPVGTVDLQALLLLAVAGAGAQVLWAGCSAMRQRDILFEQQLRLLSSQSERLTSDVVHLQERARQLSMPLGRDLLTGVANFASMMESLQALREMHARKSEPFCVVLLELDPWVAKRDAQLPSSGPNLHDRVLLMLSGLLVTHLRAVDRVGRFDGDVFMMILQDTSSAQAIFALQRVRDGMRASTWHDNELPDPAPLTITMTVAQYMESETAERLVQRAEKALQACRATGRNQIVIAEDIDSSRDI